MDLLVILSVAAAFCAGYIYREIKFIKHLAQSTAIREKAIQDAKDILRGSGIREVVPLEHEILSGVNYFYKSGDGSFAGQGLTLEDAAAHYNLLHGPDKIGWFRHADTGAQYYFSCGNVQEMEGNGV